jgi:hypothetical protein
MGTRNATLSPPWSLRIAALGVVFVSMLAASTAFATISYVSQLRSVSTFATVDFVVGEDSFNSDLFQSQDVDQFEGAALCHAGELGNEANSTGHQLSYLLPTMILAEGNMSGQAEINGEATFAEGFGMSRIIAVFSTDVPIEAHIQGHLFAGGNGSTNFTFRIANGPIYINRTIQDADDDIDETIVLQPGSYEVLGQSSGYGQALANGGGQPASGSYSFSFLFNSSTAAPEIAAGLANPFAPVVAPNPVRGLTHIAPASGTARLYQALDNQIVILDLAGRVVRRFENVGEAGVTWDTRDSNGSLVAAGIYLVRGATGESTRAVVLR